MRVTCEVIFTEHNVNLDWPVLDVVKGGRNVNARPTTSHAT